MLVPLPVRRKRLLPGRSEPPRVTKLLLKAEHFRGLLDAGEMPNQAFLGRRYGLTRARVTQILNLLRLAPEIQAFIKSLSAETPERMVTEKKLRRLARLDRDAQVRWAEGNLEGFTVGQKIVPLIDDTRRKTARHA